jgi:Photosynthesis system II assembly factor YCF48
LGKKLDGPFASTIYAPNMKLLVCLFLSMSFFFVRLAGQTLKSLARNDKISIRGLSVVDDNVVWVSGSNGTVGKSVDGGILWEWMIVPHFEKRDFRDIEAFDAKTALIMAVAEPGIILRTTDGGKTWETVFSDSTQGMFLDAMHFTSSGKGIVIGDPIHQKLFIAHTENAGKDWTSTPASKSPLLAEGEAFFAASGTNVRLIPGNNGDIHVLFVSGGKKSRLWLMLPETVVDSLPLVQGQESTGANSVDLYDANTGIIVGGDFSHDSSSLGNCALFSLDHPHVFEKPETSPHGYRSCVAYLSKNNLIACGTTGVDISSDGGKNWTLISTEGFHVCQKAKKGNSVFLAGSHGRISKLIR